MVRAPKATIPPERPAPGAPEHLRAEWWRVHVVKLARPALAERLGYSVSQIARYESGAAPIEPAYRLACAALTAGVQFDWLQTSFELAPGVTVTRTAADEPA